ncbi:gamma-glutamyltransferase [Orrella sp. JC864]|uniref:gamma-glutamyltransferase n=1 Tax=Orrella sp. JC864 TaxID=3120298 RepID=UPI00300AB8F3
MPTARLSARLLLLLASLCAWLPPAAARQPGVPPAAAPVHAPVAGPAAQPAVDVHPEPGSGYQARALVRAQRHMLVSAHPLASQAGESILAAGGSALDAAIAAQLVLNLVEPQSSGVGGGAFLMHYAAQAQRLSAYDGRETAPAAARAGRFMQDGAPMRFADAVNSGRSVGTPGLLRMLEMAHREHGVLPWADLFAPAIALAEQGFAVSPRLHALVAATPELARQPEARRYFYDGQGKPWPVGHRLRNPAFAQVLREVAARGADAFYHGDIARDMVAAVRAHAVPGDLSEADLAGYRAVRREPVCGAYRGYRLCGMPPPSSGTLAVLQILGMLEPYPMQAWGPGSLQAVHYFAEAGRLAFADRDRYVADPDFAEVPVKALLEPAYLRARSALIDPARSLGTAPAGDPLGRLAQLGQDDAPELPSTTHLVAVDAQGNAVSMTATIESAFGSKIFVRGFLLNNELTDFSLSDRDAQGRPVLNRVQPGKRPRSSMAPMIVFRGQAPYLLVGSPGGSAIINYVAKTLVGVIDWGLDIQAAIDLPNLGSRNRATELERGTALEALAPSLEKMGHEVTVMEMPSGVHGIMIQPQGLAGGADPRREGLAAGR